MLTEKKNGNYVIVRGTLSEKNLEKTAFGNNQNCIRGDVVIKVVQDDQTMFIPVRVFCSELKKDGTVSALYKTWNEVYETYKSIAAVGEAEADRVECRGARLMMNEYYKGDKLISFPAISSNFISKNPKASDDEASWTATMVVGKCGYKMDADGIEDKNTYEIMGILPRYNGSVDIVPILAKKASVIDVVSQYWQPNDTVNAMGKLNFTQEERTSSIPSDFGEPVEHKYTVNVSEIVLNGGTSTPLEGEFAYNMDDIQMGLATHKQALADLKQRQEDKAVSNAGKKAALDLGF